MIQIQKQQFMGHKRCKTMVSISISAGISTGQYRVLYNFEDLHTIGNLHQHMHHFMTKDHQVRVYEDMINDNFKQINIDELEEVPELLNISLDVSAPSGACGGVLIVDDIRY